MAPFYLTGAFGVGVSEIENSSHIRSLAEGGEEENPPNPTIPGLSSPAIFNKVVFIQK